MIEGLARLTSRRPGVALALVAVGTVALGAFLPRLGIDSAMETIFDRDDPELALYDEFKRTFGEDEFVAVGLRAASGDVFSAATLGRIRRITQAVEALPAELGVERVVSLTTVDDVRGTAAGIEVGPLVPAGALDDPALPARIRARTYANPLLVRNLVSEDGASTAVNVALVHRPGDRIYKERLVAAVREIVERERGPDEAFYAGIPVLTVYTSEHLRRDMAVFIPLTLLVIALVLGVTFRSAAGVLLPLLTVGLSVVWTLGLMGLLGRSVSILSSIVPSLLIAIGCAYAVHVLGQVHQEEEPAPRERIAAAVRHVGLPVLLAALTTAVGFGSLATSDIDQVREFGGLSAFGILAAGVLAVLFVPAALVWLRPRRLTADDQDLVRGPVLAGLERLAGWVLRRPRPVLAVAVVVVGLAAWGVLRIRVDTDYAANFPADSAPVRALLFMRHELSGERPINVVVRARAAGEDALLDPAALRRLDELEGLLAAHRLVGATVSIGGYLKNLHAAIQGRPLAEGTLPESADAAAQLLALYGRPAELRRYLSADGRSATILGRSSIISSEELLRFTGELVRVARERWGDELEVTVTGSMYHLSKASIAVTVGQARSLVVATAVIFLLMLGVFRSLRLGLIALVPNALPILLNFALMGALGVTLNIGTSIMAAMALGVAVDDTIHFLARYGSLRRELPVEAAVRETMRTAGRHIVFTSVTNLCGFLVLTLSSFAPLVALGWLTALTMASALVADLVLLPALLVTFDRRAPSPARAGRR